MQFIGRIGNLLDGIDADTSDTPNHHESFSRGAQSNPDDARQTADNLQASSGGLVGRGFGFLTSAATAAGNVTGSLRELVSDEGGGGSLEAKIAAWDPFGIIEDKDSIEDEAAQHNVKVASQDSSSALAAKSVAVARTDVKSLKPSDEEDLFGGWDSDSDGAEETCADPQHKLEVKATLHAEEKHEPVRLDHTENATSAERLDNITNKREDRKVSAENASDGEDLFDGWDDTEAPAKHDALCPVDVGEKLNSKASEDVADSHENQGHRLDSTKAVQDDAESFASGEEPTCKESSRTEADANEHEHDQWDDGWDDMETIAKDPTKSEVVCEVGAEEKLYNNPPVDVPGLHESQEKRIDSTEVAQSIAADVAECPDDTREAFSSKDVQMDAHEQWNDGWDDMETVAKDPTKQEGRNAAADSEAPSNIADLHESHEHGIHSTMTVQSIAPDVVERLVDDRDTFSCKEEHEANAEVNEHNDDQWDNGWDDVEAPAKDPAAQEILCAAESEEKLDTKVDSKIMSESQEQRIVSTNVAQSIESDFAECPVSGGETFSCKEKSSKGEEEEQENYQWGDDCKEEAPKAEVEHEHDQSDDDFLHVSTKSDAEGQTYDDSLGDIGIECDLVEEVEDEHIEGARVSSEIEKAEEQVTSVVSNTEALGATSQGEGMDACDDEADPEKRYAFGSGIAEECRQDEEELALSQALAVAQLEISKGRAELERLQAEASVGSEQLEQQRLAAQSEIASLKEELERMRLAASETADRQAVSAAAANEEIAKLKKALEDQTASVAEARNSAQEASARTQALIEEQQSATEELARTKAKLDHFQMEVSCGTEQKDQQLAASQAEVVSLKQEIEILQAAASESTQQLAQQKAVADEEILQLKTSLAEQVAVASEASASSSESISKLQKAMDEQQAAQEELSRTKAELERLQTESSAGAAQKTDELNAAQSELVSLKQELERMRAVTSEDNAAAEEEILKLRSAMEQQRAALTEAQSSSQEELSKLQALMREQQVMAHDEMSKANAELERLRAEASAGVEQKEHQLGAAHAEVASLKEKIEHYELVASENSERLAASTATAAAAEQEISRLKLLLEQQRAAISSEVAPVEAAEATHDELSKLRVSSAEHNRRADLAEASVAQLQEEYARLQASISQATPQGVEGKLADLERERESFIARVSDAEARAREAERRVEQILKDDAVVRAPSDNNRIRSVVGGDSTPKGKSQPLEIADLEAGSRSKPSDKPSESGCVHEADRPLHFIARQLSASQLWRRVFFSYLLLLHLWTFFILHRHS